MPKQVIGGSSGLAGDTAFFNERVTMQTSAQA